MAADGLLIGVGLLAGVALGPLALLLVPPAVLMLHLMRHDVRYVALAIAIASVLVGAVRGHLAEPIVAIDALQGSTGAIAVVEALPVAGGEFERTVVRVERVQLQGGSWTEASGRVLVYLPDSGPGVSLGDQVFLVWSATPVEHLAPGYAGFVESQRAAATANVWFYSIEQRGNSWFRTVATIRRRTISNLRQAIPGDAGALASGIVTGDDSGLSEAAQVAFRRTGTGHVTAVSGQNVSLLIGFLALWMRPGRRSTRLLTHGVMLLVVWIYVIMVGLEPPAIRAAIVATFMMLGAWSGRRPDPLTILAITLGGMVLIDPAMVDRVGFWLSAAASWALCSSMTTEQVSGFADGALNVARGVMAANIATLPILLWTFGEWSPISLLANLLVGPIMTATFPAAYLLAVISFAPSVVPWFSWIPAIGLDFALAIVDRLSQVMPLLRLPVTGPAMALAIALPCFGTLALISRDGERWRRVAVQEWRHSGPWLRIMASGLVVGIGVGVIAGMLLR